MMRAPLSGHKGLIKGLALLTLLLLSTSCVSASQADGHTDADAHSSVTGVLTAVDGDLTTTRRIEILTNTGASMSFRVAETATFDGGPVSHVRDHLLSGLPITIEYQTLGDGQLEATYLEDAHDS